MWPLKMQLWGEVLRWWQSRWIFLAPNSRTKLELKLNWGIFTLNYHLKTGCRGGL